MKGLSGAVGLSVSALLIGFCPLAAEATYQQCMNEVGFGKNRNILSTYTAEKFYCLCMSQMENGREPHFYCLGIAHSAEAAEKFYANRQPASNRYDLLREALRSNPYDGAIMKAPNISF